MRKLIILLLLVCNLNALKTPSFFELSDEDIRKNMEIQLQNMGVKESWIKKLNDYLCLRNHEKLISTYTIDYLFVFGNHDINKAEQAAKLYHTYLKKRGCKTIVFSGGIGKGSQTLIKNLGINNQEQLYLPFLNIRKPVFTGDPETLINRTGEYDTSNKELVSQYISEAEIYTELFLVQMLKYGYSLNDFIVCTNGDIPISNLDQDKIVIIVENHSINTYDNVILTLDKLEYVFRYKTCANVVLIQHASRQRRAYETLKTYSWFNIINYSFEKENQLQVLIQELKKLYRYITSDRLIISKLPDEIQNIFQSYNALKYAN